MRSCSLLLLFLAAAGCTRVEDSKPFGSAGPVKRDDPWPAAVADISRMPDLVTARRALNQLNADLDAAAALPPMLNADDTAKIAAKLKPSAEEAKDWASRTYTPMDTNYLGECLAMKAVVRSLDLDGLPPRQQATAAFDWVARQLYLQSWTLTTPQGRVHLPQTPPQTTLRRGYGTGVEREAVFLGLARQLGLDAVLVGPPGLEAKPRYDGSTPRGAFWAIGVRDGGEVALFDPWLGLPFPATLAAAKANPKLITDFIEAQKSPFSVKADDVAAAVAYATAPVSAITPRIKLLEEKLAADLGVKLSVTLPDGAPIYAPPVEVDPYALPHTLGSFTPKDDGGYDPRPAGPEQLAALADREPFSSGLFTVPPELKNANARQQFLSRTAGLYKSMLLDAALREKQQRGQFNEVVRTLGELDRSFATIKERLRGEADVLHSWAVETNAAYDALQLTSLPENAGGRPAAEAKVAALWGNNSPGLAAVQNAVADVAGHEVAYLFALCKHEQAERSQTRQSRGGDAGRAVADWTVAHDAWARYAINAGKYAHLHPGRDEHAKLLADRARTLANPAGAP